MPHTNNSRYQLTAPLEILSILRTIRSSRARLRMEVPEHDTPVLTTILDIDHKDNRLTVDSAPEMVANQRIARADTIAFQTDMEGVQVTFATGRASLNTFENRTALHMPLPETLMRLQRREHFRIDIPSDETARCLLPVSPRSVTLEINDISSGGISVSDFQGSLADAVGQTLANCILELPGASGPITVSLKVLHQRSMALPHGRIALYFGCAFMDLSRGAEVSIQRYISQLERRKIARNRNLS